MFKRKEKIIRREIEYKVEVVQAEAMRIVKDGTYVLQLNYSLPNEQLKLITESIKKSTGAKWIIVNGGGNVIQVN